MKTLFPIALALVALTASLAAAPVEGAATADALAQEINGLLETSAHSGVVAVHVEQREPARVLFSLHGDRTMVPASNNKLHTTAAAIHFLGADHRRHTRLMVNGPIVDGVLRGDLVVVGDGDPSISGRFNGGHILASFEAWAELLSQHGIHEISGNVVGDDDLFDDQLTHPSWGVAFPTERGEWYCAESSALSFNDNCVDLHWVAGENVGDTPTYTRDPTTPYLTFDNQTTTTPADADTDRYYHREETSNHIIITGGIQHGQERNDSAAVHNPTLYAVTVLADVLSREGIAVRGLPIDIDDLDREEVHAHSRPLLSAPSPPMSTLIRIINQRSQNLYADMVLKLIGVEVEGEGSFAAGARAVERFLEEIGALPGDPEAWVMVDGSGLSPLNRTTPRCLVALLRHMDTEPGAAAFRASLPRGQAETGSLRNRFDHSDRHRAVAPNIRGKTGYIETVWTLSGIATNQAGEDLHFSIMLNGYEAENVPPLRMIDDIAVAIAASTIGGDE